MQLVFKACITGLFESLHWGDLKRMTYKLTLTDNISLTSYSYTYSYMMFIIIYNNILVSCTLLQMITFSDYQHLKPNTVVKDKDFPLKS